MIVSLRPGPSREELIAWYQDHRWEQHQSLFVHRHSRDPALFHTELIELFWSNSRRAGVFAFRGSAKSTLAEEFATIAACELAARNIVFVGASEGRAAERIAAVKRELERNEDLVELYGEQRGDEAWTQTRLITRNNVCIQALGRDQDIRGLKHLDWRPDLLIVDDFEDRDNVSTPEARRKTFTWFRADLLPACTPDCKIRVLATPMDPESVPMQLSKSAGWAWRTYPIIRRHPQTGEEEATWPALFPLDWISRERQEYQSSGQAALWDREFLCEAVSVGEQVFRAEDIRIEPRVRTWEPVWVMIDPARTTHRETSAMTGIVVWSWIGSKLVVWDDRTDFYRPDETISVMFDLDRQYQPVFVGIEENGLEQWLQHAIVQEMARRGAYLPVKPMRAPRDKLGFIGGLQPFLTTGALVFAQDLPELRAQLLGFPRGRIDGPNALAYALPLRPGIPVYEDFNPNIHVADRVMRMPDEPMFLALNSDRRLTTGVLMQATASHITVLGDWICEGDPAIAAPSIIQTASMFAAGPRLEIKLPQSHADPWNNVGLLQAAKSVAARQIGIGLDPGKGREYLRRKLSEMPRGRACVQIAAGARFTLAAISAGYAQPHGKPEPEAGVHRLLMEAVESTLALCAAGLGHSDASYSYTSDGKRYLKYGSAHEPGGTRAPLRIHNPNWPQ